MKRAAAEVGAWPAWAGVALAAVYLLVHLGMLGRSLALCGALLRAFVGR
jgi:hypothetical protein